MVDGMAVHLVEERADTLVFQRADPRDAKTAASMGDAMVDQRVGRLAVQKVDCLAPSKDIH